MLRRLKYKVITHQGQQITQVSWTDASHQEVQASRWLSDLKTVHQLADGPSDDLDGEFDPGSGRTLAACLTHASRTLGNSNISESGERVSNT